MENILFLLSKYFYYKPVELRKILEGFKKLEDVLEAPKDVFFKLGVGSKALDEFLNSRKQENNKTIKQEDIKILTIFDEYYPEKLKHLCDAPPILFYKGDLSCLNGGCLAVIGSRKITEYGKRVGQQFVKGLCNNFVIVSGLAYGVDGLAHKITVDNNGKTIAVLGSGLDNENIYPKTNFNLAQEIVEKGGLLLSEVPPGVGPQVFHFPMRNRIIAGLSQGILIVEGGKKSGTLITAKLGIDYGADIFAVPNNIFHPNSEGVNYLIKCGAHPVTSADDILEFYGIEKKEVKKIYAPKNDLEKIILDNLSGDPKHINNLSELSKAEVMELMGVLTDLEMEGVVKNLGGQRYIKT
ncbi:DNA-processing protein DprA [Candidatus Parcubacteria bacterium]|nr:DNA-processing protein DprA [Patescibacteria group bacterium]MCG2693957.1 DNA-processing protein DprA [Candidatus Parcubacteria bacterium]